MALDAPLREAIDKLGGPAKAAAALGITPGAIQQWKRAPLGRVVAISRLTGIPAAELRPDLAEIVASEPAHDEQVAA